MLNDLQTCSSAFSHFITYITKVLPRSKSPWASAKLSATFNDWFQTAWPGSVFPCSRTMLLAMTSAFLRSRCWSLLEPSEKWCEAEDYAYSITKRWRPRTLVLLHDLKASDAASTACLNSVSVVWGTLESNAATRERGHHVMDINQIESTLRRRIIDFSPVWGSAFNKLPSDKILCCSYTRSSVYVYAQRYYGPTSSHARSLPLGELIYLQLSRAT